MLKYWKHLIHVVIFYTSITVIPYYGMLSESQNPVQVSEISPIGLVLFALQLVGLLAVPITICNILGLTFYNISPGKIEIDEKLLDSKLGPSEIKINGDNSLAAFPQVTNGAGQTGLVTTTTTTTTTNSHPIASKLSYLPHLCIRVVTRGLFPELVDKNVNLNLLTCLEASLENFSIEVVTDIPFKLTSEDARVRQIVVPANYETSTKAKFKARALQYALEDGVSPCQDDDYIIHLDEETLITRNVVHGIVNFVLEAKHPFGQGVINYMSIEVVNVLATLADSFRVARDFANIRFTLACLHRPIFGIKGSFVVTKCSAEKDVSFDHGEDGSIAEDCYFAMVAYMKGYTFDYILGEMCDKSPFTMMEVLKQRKRWLQGTWLVVRSPKIPWNTKFFLATCFCAWLTLPLTSLGLIGFAVKVPYVYYFQPINMILSIITVYQYILGLFLSYEFGKQSIAKFVLYMAIQIFATPIYFAVENVVVIWGAFTNKYNFYIVKKDQMSHVTSAQREAVIVATS